MRNVVNTIVTASVNVIRTNRTTAVAGVAMLSHGDSLRLHQLPAADQAGKPAKRGGFKSPAAWSCSPSSACSHYASERSSRCRPSGSLRRG